MRQSMCAAPAALFVLGLVCRGAVSAPPLTLFDFDGAFDVGAVAADGARVALVKAGERGALRIATSRDRDWPGITLKAPGAAWDLSAYESVTLDVANVGANTVTVSCRVDNPGADGQTNCCTGSVKLAPGERGVLSVRLERAGPGARGVRLFGMRGYPVPQSDKNVMDPSNVVQLVVFVPKPRAEHLFEIDNIRAAGVYIAPKMPEGAGFLPFIDELGQYIHRDWPGKTRSAADLAEALQAELAELGSKAGPQDWDEYGGWEAGPQLEATGFFRTEKWGGRWWLVDPKGRLFFSHGIDCVNAWGATPVEDRLDWFRNLPPEDSEFRAFYSRQHAIHGHYKGRSPNCFDFIGANLQRKYGPEWRKASAELAHRRLRSWGLNTIGNWSDEGVYLLRKTPYVVAVHFNSKVLQGSEGYWGQFKDVFDPDFKDQLRRRMAREKSRSAGDPWCIGYFIDNELSWGDELSLALAALASPPDQAAKRAFVEDLKAKYRTIDALNQAWRTQHASWEALLEHRGPPDKSKARNDLVAFYDRIAETYFSTCREAVKEVAPRNLYLGCRFAWVNDRAARAAAKYCDVVSYNLYRKTVRGFKFPGGADVPLIIGEFHFGALDRGMFHAGLVPVKDQAERAAAYKDYVRGVLAHPAFVGCHWFQYRDQPTTGRPLDEENYQIGFVDVADSPYPETVAASREVGYALYKLRAAGGR